MMKSDQHSNTIRISLQRGQSHQQYLKAGAIIRADNGKATVHEAPQWLAEKMVWMQHSLRDHESYTVIHSGWLSIHASEAATISIRPALTYRAGARKYAAACLRTLACSIARGRQNF
jgi:hypothetical protein